MGSRSGDIATVDPPPSLVSIHKKLIATPLGWGRACLLMRGAYSGVEVTPGSPREKLLLVAQDQQDYIETRKTMALVLAAAGSSDLSDAWSNYLRAASPAQAVKERGREALQKYVIENWDEATKGAMGTLQRHIKNYQAALKE